MRQKRINDEKHRVSLFSVTPLIAMHQQQKSTQIRRDYKEWNAKEYKEGNWVQKEWSLIMLKMLNVDVAGLKILDAGCGVGFLAEKLLEMGADDV